jgi:hypothetical protein
MTLLDYVGITIGEGQSQSIGILCWAMPQHPLRRGHNGRRKFRRIRHECAGVANQTLSQGGRNSERISESREVNGEDVWQCPCSQQGIDLIGQFTANQKSAERPDVDIEIEGLCMMTNNRHTHG